MAESPDSKAPKFHLESKVVPQYATVESGEGVVADDAAHRSTLASGAGAPLPNEQGPK